MSEFVDAAAECFVPGVPRAMSCLCAARSFQAGNEILMSFGFASATRMIHLMNRGRCPGAGVDGLVRWPVDGDTLVVDVMAQNGP